MVEYTPTQGDSEHPIQLQEITVTAQAPKFKSTPSAKTGVDMYIGRNYDPEFNKHYYGMSHLDALLGKVRVENMKKADPQVIKNFRDGSNAAAAFFAAPLAAYGAGEYVLPWIAQNVAPYLSARGWLAATQAAGNTPAWLTPTSATAIDAALAGGTTGVSVSDMIQNGPTVGNVLGTTAGVVGLGAEAAPTIMEGIQAGQKAYNTVRDFMWLGKAYDKVGTGLKNPYVRNKFWDLAQNPSLSRNFIETYSREGNEAGLNLSQIKEAIPQLQQLQKEFGITPRAGFNNYQTVEEQIGEIRSGLEDARRLVNGYTKGLEFLKGKNQVLYNIAKESPQYLNQIVSDFKAGNITNLEEYVKGLIRQSNTFVRRMNLKPGVDPIEAFSQIRGRSMGQSGFAMDVGNPEVVNHPIWSRGYGNQAALYTPKEVNPQGPIETWWSQRIPKFQDQSISVNPEGMHTSREGVFRDLNLKSVQSANDYLKSQRIPSSYGRTDSHMVFNSPNEGASILDQFNITPYNKLPRQLRYTLGYQKGGKLCKKLKNI